MQLTVIGSSDAFNAAGRGHSCFLVEGEGFERVNIACPRAILADALERIRGAVEELM